MLDAENVEKIGVDSIVYIDSMGVGAKAPREVWSGSRFELQRCT